MQKTYSIGKSIASTIVRLGSVEVGDWPGKETRVGALTGAHLQLSRTNDRIHSRIVILVYPRAERACTDRILRPHPEFQCSSLTSVRCLLINEQQRNCVLRNPG